MDKDSAKKLIRETFERSFERDRFIYFAKNLLNKIDESGSTILKGSHLPDSYKPHIESLEYVGSYEDSEGSGLDVLIVQLKKETSIDRARAMQRNFISWYLNGGRSGVLRDASLVAFVSPSESEWRFSFVKMEYKFVEDKQGKSKVKEEFTPSRRYSFLVGENENSHTAQFQLLSLLENDEENPALAEIEYLFNIEVVTKEFFEQYRGLCLDINDALVKLVEKDSKIKADFEDKNIDTVEFSKKLLGQIVFLYFLQKKGWFGVEREKDWGTGPKNFLRQLFKKEIGSYSNFFNDILEPLFYEALALERTHDYYGNLGCKIPFLNGGLFDPLNNYDWVHTDILIPNDLFSNSTKTSKGDVGTGILDVFDRFNFTVREDEPLEKEVAVDPEMLGKVFENLLEVKDRKSKGTYYTPREIVHYMCQESLAHYLEAELNGNVSKEEIDTLIKFGETVVEHDSRVAKSGKETGRYSFKLPESIRKNAESLDTALAKIRVCDPAVGSGAFLVGMMSEIVSARNALTNYLNKDADRSCYYFKRHAIGDSLYGVDIAHGAIEICKLRLWLSLIVDEDDIKQIQPLPNLDYKIVAGNSLQGVRKDLFNDSLFKELEELKPKYFNETNIKRKQKYKEEIDALIDKITSGKKDFDFEVYFSEIFHEKKGFDILIANPPYIGESGHKELFRETRKGPLKNFYQGKMDIFYFFFHLSLNLGKQNSHISFISTNYYLTATGAIKLRLDLKNRSIIRNLINFNELKIFDSAQGQHNIITTLNKASDIEAFSNNATTKITGPANQNILQGILNWEDAETDYFKVKQKDIYEGDNYYIRPTTNLTKGGDNINQVLEKTKSKSKLLGAICFINQGVVSGCDYVSQKSLSSVDQKKEIRKGDGIFVFDLKNERDQEIIQGLTQKERLYLKPFFKNSDIGKYWSKSEPTKQVLYLDREFSSIRSYPNIEKHLRRFHKILNSRREVQNQVIKYFQLQWPRTEDIFICKKIVAPYRSKTNSFGYNENEWFCRSDSYVITERNKNYDLKFILALLNSKLYYAWLYFKGKRKGETLELFAQPLSEIPIKDISKSEQQPLILIVNKILAITSRYKNSNDSEIKIRKYVQEIDRLVYKINELTQNETQQIERLFD